VTRSRTRLLGASLLVLCGLLSCVAFASGLAAFGKETVSYGCAVEAPRPMLGGPYLEDTEVLVAERTLLPLGAVCVLDAPDDGVGPQTVRVPSWPQTIVWLASGTAALVGLLLLVLPGCTIRAVEALRHRRELRQGG
jgi:hypothetical protein